MGLDIYVHDLVLPDDETKANVLPYEKVHEKYPNATIKQYSEIRIEPPDFPKEYLFDTILKFISYKKLFERNSTPERPLNWEDGWVAGGGGTCPFFGDEDKKVDGCTWYSYFYQKDPKTDEISRHISLPTSEGFIKDCLVEETCKCFMYDNEELGYMRKGANCDFYDDMNGGRASNWVFSKEILNRYAEKYFDEEDNEYHGNARAAFKANIQDPFGDGKGKMVWFWY